MRRRLVLLLPVVSIAIFILFFSVFQASAIEYELAPSPVASSMNHTGIGPTHPLWHVKAAGQKVDFVLSGSDLSKAHKALEFANERLGYSQDLFYSGQVNDGVAVLTKAEKYLQTAAQLEESARKKGDATREFRKVLYEASVNHKNTIDVIAKNCPDTARAIVVKTGDYPAMLSKLLNFE